MKQVAVAAGVCAVLVPIALFGTFGSSSICKVCGCSCHITNWQLPFTSVTYWRYRRTDETPISELANRLGLVPAHDHDWVFIHGSGNGITCALGNGGNLYHTSRSPHVAAFLTCVSRIRDVDESATWLRTALDERDGKWFVRWLEEREFPVDGFESAEAFDAWHTTANWPEYLESHSE